MSFLVLSFLGGDNNNTISATGTVDSGSRSVLENINGCHIVHINHIERHICRYPVNHYQRLRVVDTTDTTNIQAHVTSWSTRTYNLQPGCSTFQCHSDRRRRHFLQVLFIHLRYSSGQITLFLNAISHYNHFFKQLSILFENDVHISRSRKCLGSIPYITNFQHRTFGHIEGEVTIKIGNCSVSGALL